MKLTTIGLSLFIFSCYQKVNSSGLLSLEQKELPQNPTLPFILSASTEVDDLQVDRINVQTNINYGTAIPSKLTLTRDICLMSDDHQTPQLCIKIKGSPNEPLRKSDLKELEAVGLMNCTGSFSNLENCSKNPSADKHLAFDIRITDSVSDQVGRTLEVNQAGWIQTQSISTFDNTGVLNPAPQNSSTTPLLPIICESMPLNKPCFLILTNPSTNKGLQIAQAARLLSYKMDGVQKNNVTDTFSFEGDKTGKLVLSFNALFQNNNIPFQFHDLYRDGYTRHGNSLETDYSKQNLEEMRIQYLDGPGKMSIVKIQLVSILKR